MVQDVSPFCSYDMFADINRSVSAVSFRVAGAPANIFNFNDFYIENLSSLYPGDYTGFLVPQGGGHNLSPAEMSSYVLGHSTKSPQGPNRVEVQFLLVRTGWNRDGGQFSISSRALCQGTARWR